jgi:hypothetical protein
MRKRSRRLPNPGLQTPQYVGTRLSPQIQHNVPDYPPEIAADGAGCLRGIEPLLIQQDHAASGIEVHHPNDRATGTGTGDLLPPNHSDELRGHPFNHVNRPAQLPDRLIQSDP